MIAAIALWSVFASVSSSAIKTEVVEYKEGQVVLEGFLVYDDSITGPRPGVVVVHEWMGLGDYAKRRARELAERGYVALAADIYGKGVRPKDAKEAGALAGKYKGDRALLRARANAALETLRRNPRVDGRALVAMGYCFGGTTVLELARGGADLLGVISFHGGLDTPLPADAKTLKARVLVLHGAEDPYVPAKDVDAFEQEMRAAKADWQLVKYAGAVHSFTVPTAGNDASKGAAYDERADRRSSRHLTVFLEELFAK